MGDNRDQARRLYERIALSSRIILVTPNVNWRDQPIVYRETAIMGSSSYAGDLHPDFPVSAPTGSLPKVDTAEVQKAVEKGFYSDRPGGIPTKGSPCQGDGPKQEEDPPEPTQDEDMPEPEIRLPGDFGEDLDLDVGE